MSEIDRKIVLAGKLETIGNPLRKVFTKEGWKVFEFHGAEDAEREIHLYNVADMVFVMDESMAGDGSLGFEKLITAMDAAEANGVRYFCFVAEEYGTDKRHVERLQMAEKLVDIWASRSGIAASVLHMPEILGKEADGPAAASIYTAADIRKDGLPNGLPEDVLHVDDAAYGVYRVVSRSYVGDLSFRIQGNTSEEIGFLRKYDVRRTYELFKRYSAERAEQRLKEKRGVKRGKISDALKKDLVPYIENAAGALLMAGVAYLQGGNPVNHATAFDMNYLYIATMGLLYGKRHALISMVLSTIILLWSLIAGGSNLIALLYMPSELLHITSYLFAAVLIGFFADGRSYERESALWRHNEDRARIEDMRHLYDQNAEIKDGLYHRIVNSDDSIGRIYRIVKKLDSVSVENVFTQAAVVASLILDVRNIAVYVMGSEQHYLRQKVHMGEIAEKAPRSLSVKGTSYLADVVQKKEIYVNRELVKDVPDLAAPVVWNGDVIAVVEVFGMDFSQWSIDQMNLLSITTRLIAASMGRAYQYEAEAAGRRYIEGTRVMREDEFRRILSELSERRRLAGGFNMSMLRVDMDGMNVNSFDERCGTLVRSEDFIGEMSGGIYILLPDADDEITRMVQQRLSYAGIKTEAVEAAA